MDKVLAVIPARGGSKGVLRKNIRPVNGKPLIAYTIEEALKSKVVSRVIVSTEDPEIADIALRLGADVPFVRPAELAKDQTLMVPVVKHALSFVEAEEGLQYDYVILLQPTAPLRLAEDIDGAFAKLASTGADSVISVCQVDDVHPIRMKKIVDDRIKAFCIEETEGTRRQDLPAAFMRNGAIYAARRSTLMDKDSLRGDDSRPYVMPRERSVSIDNELDMKLAAIMLSERSSLTPAARSSNSVELLWKSWYGNEKISLGFPERWNLKVIPMKDAPVLTDAEIRDRILNPLDSPRIRELARGKKRVAIAIDDLDRPTETFRMLPTVLEELYAAGLTDKNIIIVASIGSHRPMTRMDLEKKIGEEVVRKIRVYNHNPYENLTYVGKTSYGTPLHINKFFAEADLKIGIGHLSPHPFAGFSGGGKIVLPGLAGMDTIELNHKPTNSALSGRIGQVEGNTRRTEIDEAGKLAGLEFVINAVSNSEGRTAGLFAGEITQVFKTAARFAQEVYATDVPYQMDIGVFNLFPKDTHMLQALNALNIWSTRDPEKSLVRRGGAIVITMACTEGPGYHGLSDIGMRLHTRRDKHGTFKDLLEGRKLIFFSPNLTEGDVYDHYPPEVLLFHDWQDVIRELEKDFGDGSRVAVYPSAPLQIDNGVR